MLKALCFKQFFVYLRYHKTNDDIMGDKALQDAYKLFKDTGYNGSLEDFQKLMEENEKRQKKELEAMLRGEVSVTPRPISEAERYRIHSQTMSQVQQEKKNLKKKRTVKDVKRENEEKKQLEREREREEERKQREPRNGYAGLSSERSSHLGGSSEGNA